MAMKQKGFTLVEVMWAAMIFSVATLGLGNVYLSVAALTESKRNELQAMADARVVLDEIQKSSKNGVQSVTATNWNNWARSNGLSSLGDEAVWVTYRNYAGTPGTLPPDPLEVNLRVDWRERNRQRSVWMDTLVTAADASS